LLSVEPDLSVVGPAIHNPSRIGQEDVRDKTAKGTSARNAKTRADIEVANAAIVAREWRVFVFRQLLG
jgi:hypothetical protein